jgi:hypothetical protein
MQHVLASNPLAHQSLRRKIQDRGEVTCAEGSLPDSIVGRTVSGQTTFTNC